MNFEDRMKFLAIFVLLIAGAVWNQVAHAQVVLNWTAPTLDTNKQQITPAGYNLYYGTNPANLAKVTLPASPLTYTVKEATSGTWYFAMTTLVNAPAPDNESSRTNMAKFAFADPASTPDPTPAPSPAPVPSGTLNAYVCKVAGSFYDCTGSQVSFTATPAASDFVCTSSNAPGPYVSGTSPGRYVRFDQIAPTASICTCKPSSCQVGNNVEGYILKSNFNAAPAPTPTPTPTPQPNYTVTPGIYTPKKGNSNISGAPTFANHDDCTAYLGKQPSGVYNCGYSGEKVTVK